VMRYQPCCSHTRSWQVYTCQKLEELPISPLSMSPFFVFFLPILVNPLAGDSQAYGCDSFMCTTQAWSVITKTLIFDTCYSCSGRVVGTCTYSVCSHDDQHISILTPFITFGSNG
jgi:hypothetical protein